MGPAGGASLPRDEVGGGPPPAAAPQSPVNLLARLEPATIWSDGLFMEPGGGGPGPDLANLEAISSPGAGSVWSSHQRVAAHLALSSVPLPGAGSPPFHPLRTTCS